jgi:hypothetical protein
MTVRAGFLFGSHVDSMPDAYSDVDLAVFVESLESWDIFERADMTALVQREVGDDMELHYFPAHTLESCDPASFAAYVLRHGVPIDRTFLKAGSRKTHDQGPGPMTRDT